MTTKLGSVGLSGIKNLVQNMVFNLYRQSVGPLQIVLVLLFHFICAGDLHQEGLLIDLTVDFN